MSFVCPPCGTAVDVPTSYFGCLDITRRAGSNHFILIDCETGGATGFGDILDTANWNTHVAANDVHISPPGSVVINAPTATAFTAEGCGRQFVGEATYTIDFTTYQFGADNPDSGAATNPVAIDNIPDSMHYWCNVFDNASRYRIMFYDCDTQPIYYVDDAYFAEAIAQNGASANVAGSVPGYEFSISVIPHWVAGEQNLGLWTVQFSIVKEGMMKFMFLPDVLGELA